MRFLTHALRILGVDLQSIFNLRNLPRYLREFRLFKKSGGSVGRIYPMIGDYKSSAGVMSGHYYHQDLYVAQKIFLKNPERHIDVGSRIDGFVAHVAAFREIQVLDIRNLISKSKNIVFRQADLMNPASKSEKADSVSCLHVLEHFGLGRYGDSINPNGHLVGFQNLAEMVTIGGHLYLSFPIGDERVEFNAHRVIGPRSPLTWDSGDCELKLVDFAFVDDSGDLHPASTIDSAVSYQLAYGCGIYTFERTG